MTETLNRCPFCGEKAVYSFKPYRNDAVNFEKITGCPQCNIWIQGHCNSHDFQAEAWNRRAPAGSEITENDGMTPSSDPVQSIIGLLEPISEQNWHGKWRIKQALEILGMAPKREYSIQSAAKEMASHVHSEEWDYKDYEYAALICAKAWGLKATEMTVNTGIEDEDSRDG